MEHIGIHVSKLKFATIQQACEATSDEFKCPVMQIFLGTPRGGFVTKIDPTFGEFIKENGLRVYGHTSYTTSVDPAKSGFLTEQLASASEHGIRGAVFHVPKVNAKSFASSLAECMEGTKYSTELLLEHKAMIPSPLSLETPEKINKFMLAVLEQGIKARFVLDTAHIFAGDVPVRTEDEAEEYLAGLEDEKWIGLLHLNGNAIAGAHKDKHATAFSKHDKIWRKMPYATSGFAAFYEFGKRIGIDTVVETKDQKAEKVELHALFDRI